ncbi:HAD-like domain-containing protein [Xylariaceae sp. FL0255]|nr:HAD-like domain-containing protein [Xylariaceae sp. FL0255]
MSSSETTFPGIRACIFDMDGLLINTEDLNTKCTNDLLQKYGRPVYPNKMRAHTMGLPISRVQWKRDLHDLSLLSYSDCQPLLGAEKLLSALSHARVATSGIEIKRALASGTMRDTYELKVFGPRVRKLIDIFPQERRMLGVDPRIQGGRNKLAPDIYLAALQSLNSTLRSEEKNIMPNDAGRRAGMRVIWVSHPQLANEYQSVEKFILAGRSGRIQSGDDGQVGDR